MCSIDKLPPSGFCLTIEERSALQVSMLQREREEKLGSKLQLWGKIFGEVNDYIVVFCLVPTATFPQRCYFYCTTTNTTLKAMPPMSDEFVEKAKACKGRFSGEPDRPLGAEEEAEEAPEDEEGEDAPKKEPFAEHHRLAYTVARIDHDVAVVPRGAFVLDATHRVIPARAYEGLGYEAAGMKRNYFHFRNPESPKAIATMAKEGLVRSADFLDPITNDAPNGIWSLNYDAANTKAVLTSLYWPGYKFFHEVESGSFGGAYFGYGLVNPDVAFML
mmetsp:Transcript_45514/g.142553  ORF Transcript_45514/g.142553 Transcript_45514/m.142553 type:complete len:275 (-) Transcript_45514:352-1176(-)|eukprot:CAMPEP_0118875784 /NCGR_PEP_ID=MMETSP1163-20130328/16727_1 /TAXON_ID=124430 /ORGANISM="Phaeomonas parva, Strain CCMP2877" /LENGTH=274 /DNA_ID=CAMNT_0006811321 /DNA_START=164 /DNA_END=988 /DNA_ORIENTATION=+